MSGFVEGIDRSQSSLFPAELEASFITEELPYLDYRETRAWYRYCVPHLKKEE